MIVKADVRELVINMDPMEAAAGAYGEENSSKAAELRAPIKRMRVIGDLYHAADLIRIYSQNMGVAAEVERIADRIAASST